MKCRVRLCGAAWDCRREVYDLQMSEFSFGFCILVIPCCCNLYRFPLERVHAVRHWHLSSGELPPCWELGPLSPLQLAKSIGRAQHFGKGTGAFEPNVVLCTLLAEKRFSPAPRAWPAMLGTPEKKESWCTQGEGAGSGRVKNSRNVTALGHCLGGAAQARRGAWFRLMAWDLLAISSGCMWPISSLILQITLAKYRVPSPSLCFWLLEPQISFGIK